MPSRNGTDRMARPTKSLGLDTVSSASQEQSTRAPIRLGGRIRLLKRGRTDQVFDYSRPEPVLEYFSPFNALDVAPAAVEHELNAPQIASAPEPFVYILYSQDDWARELAPEELEAIVRRLGQQPSVAAAIACRPGPAPAQP